MEAGLRFAYRPEYAPLLLNYLGARAGASILEVGCGTGFLARLLARSLAEVRVVGLDSDVELLGIAGRMLEKDGVAEQVTLGQGNVFQLPFANDCFDLVTSHRLL